MELLERAITVIRKHLADKTAYEWTACHISDEMKSIIRDYESIPIEPPVKPDACGKNIAGKYFLIGVGVGSNHKDIDKYRIEGLSSPPSIFNKIWDYEENKSKHSV